MLVANPFFVVFFCVFVFCKIRSFFGVWCFALRNPLAQQNLPTFVSVFPSVFSSPGCFDVQTISIYLPRFRHLCPLLKLKGVCVSSYPLLCHFTVVGQVFECPSASRYWCVRRRSSPETVTISPVYAIPPFSFAVGCKLTRTAMFTFLTFLIILIGTITCIFMKYESTE